MVLLGRDTAAAESGQVPETVAGKFGKASGSVATRSSM